MANHRTARSLVDNGKGKHEVRGEEGEIKEVILPTVLSKERPRS